MRIIDLQLTSSTRTGFMAAWVKLLESQFLRVLHTRSVRLIQALNTLGFQTLTSFQKVTRVMTVRATVMLKMIVATPRLMLIQTTNSLLISDNIDNWLSA